MVLTLLINLKGQNCLTFFCPCFFCQMEISFNCYVTYVIKSGPWTAAPALIKVIELETG